MRRIFIDNVTDLVVGDSDLFPQDLTAAEYDMTVAASLLEGTPNDHRWAFLTGAGVAPLAASAAPGIRVYAATEQTPRSSIPMILDPAAPSAMLPVLTPDNIADMEPLGFLWRL